MKTMKKITEFIFCACLGTFLLASCEKELPHQKVTPIDAPAEVSLSIDGVSETIGLMAPKTKAYNMTIKAKTKADQLLTFTIAADETKVAEYNAANGTDFEMVPEHAYEFSKTTFYLPRYNTEGTTATVTLKANGLPDDGKTRLLPVSIVKIEGDAETKMTASDSTVFITVYRVSLKDMKFENGKGTAEEPYIVEYATDLLAMHNDLKADEPTYIKLGADIDMQSLGEWMPVNLGENIKTIHLDGNGYKISNMYCNSSEKASLFGNLKGSVKNITFENCELVPGIDATGTGLIAGFATGAEFKNITVKNLTINSLGNNNHGKHLGGIVGIADGCSFENVNIEVNIPDQNEDGKNPRVVGGMAGLLQGKPSIVDNCHTKGYIFSNHYGGGLIGVVSAENQVITNCSAEVEMKTVGNLCGGFIGYANKGLTVTDSYAVGDHTSEGQFNYKGGFIGASQGGMTIKRCYHIGDYFNHSGTHIGGFVGNPGLASKDWNDNTLEGSSSFEDCFSQGKIFVSNGAHNKGRMQGGFIGVIEKAHGISLNRCYSTVSIESKGSNGGIGGIIGVATQTSTNLDISISFTMQDCIAWNEVISNDAPNISGGYSCGAICGAVAKQSTLTNNYRRADMKFTEVKAEGSYTLCDHANADALTPAGARCEYHGVAAPAGATCSQVAKSLNWPEDVWDLSGELPVLK